jgi:hypothetical protein
MENYSEFLVLQLPRKRHCQDARHQRVQLLLRFRLQTLQLIHLGLQAACNGEIGTIAQDVVRALALLARVSRAGRDDAPIRECYLLADLLITPNLRRAVLVLHRFGKCRLQSSLTRCKRIPEEMFTRIIPRNSYNGNHTLS